MKQRFLNRAMAAALLVCMVPATLLAQDTKTKEKVKDKAQKQQIVITRSGDKDEKTVIEIDGDKIKVNGKDVADLKDINVRVNNLKGSGAVSFGPDHSFNFDFDRMQPSIFRVDSNRAMLGVVTDGDDRGAEIQSVSKESAAEKAGLKKGDVITKIDNRKIETTDDVTDAIRSHKPGDKVAITYLRDGKEQKATTELGRWKGVNITAMTAPRVLTDQVWRENQNARSFERTFPNIQGNVYVPGRGPKLGMSVQDTDEGKGVKVLDVDDEGTAHKAGIKEDDIITHVDGNAVNSADEIAKLMREKKDQASVKMQINRGGKTQTIDVRVPKKIKTVDL
ncbi:MAG: PDZ domain-containing protein [Bacteroidota bacterium]|nr:PDZ domain-containing protein [Bacteroidota bacterium]